MIRELLISIYLTLFQCFFTLFRLLPVQSKTTFVATFGDNILYTAQELETTTDEPFTIIQMPNCQISFRTLTSQPVLRFQSPFHWIKSVYHLATSRVIFVDNYLGILAKMKQKQGVQYIQLWHAAGAIKRFGLEDPAYKTRSKRAKKRIQTVYQRLSHVVIGSEKMVPVFASSFGRSDLKFIRSGIPRTDFFFRPIEMRSVELVLKRKYPITEKKKVILYAPTFRANSNHNGQIHIPLDLAKLEQMLGDDYILLLRLHPSIRKTLTPSQTDFIRDVSAIRDISLLFVLTDILITDYSSIPFEFALLERPMIFFTTDLREYRHSRGFWYDYHAFVPGPVVTNSEELINVIQHGDFDLQLVQDFAKDWNQYANGHASASLVKTLYPLAQLSSKRH